MTKIKIHEFEFYEYEFKTKSKYKKAGTSRCEHLLINCQNKSAIEVLDEICRKVDCNFVEVLDAINRTTR